MTGGVDVTTDREFSEKWRYIQIVGLLALHVLEIRVT